MNRSTCNTCKQLVPAQTAERDGKVYLVKTCRACGTSETLLSGDAARYQKKRGLDPGFDYQGCGLNCLGCHSAVPLAAWLASRVFVLIRVHPQMALISS